MCYITKTVGLPFLMSWLPWKQFQPWHIWVSRNKNLNFTFSPDTHAAVSLFLASVFQMLIILLLHSSLFFLTPIWCKVCFPNPLACCCGGLWCHSAATLKRTSVWCPLTLGRMSDWSLHSSISGSKTTHVKIDLFLSHFCHFG